MHSAVSEQPMDLEQNVRWQHIILFAALVGLLAGGMITVIGLSDTASSRALPWWVGAIVLASALTIGALAFASLRRATSRASASERLARGAFELPDSTPESLARLSARVTTHFGLVPATEARPPMPNTFGELVGATTALAQTQSMVQPNQLEAARVALARVIRSSPESISWAASPVDAIPPGRERFARWEQLRALSPGLPEAKLNPWVENIAFYVFFAALIAIAVPIARRLDANEATRVEPTVRNRLAGKAFGLILFASIIGILMIPVYVIGRRYAVRLPQRVDDLGEVARHIPPTAEVSRDWTAELVATHLRELVATELGIAPSSLHDKSALHAMNQPTGNS
jgi:hypothetical protein